MKLTSTQEKIKTEILSRTHGKHVLRGYAGTGKTVTLTEIIKGKIEIYKVIEELGIRPMRPQRILIAAPTALALSVLREKVNKERIDVAYLDFKTTASLLKTPIETVSFLGKRWPLTPTGLREMEQFFSRFKINIEPAIDTRKLFDTKKRRNIEIFSVDTNTMKSQIRKVQPNMAKQPIEVKPDFMFLPDEEIEEKFVDYDFMIVDETSMIPEEDVNRLLEFPYSIMAGDPRQLPPVDSRMSPHFLAPIDNEKVFELTEMLRSTDEVLNLALAIREGRDIKSINSPHVRVYNGPLQDVIDEYDFMKYDTTLTFTNKLVDTINEKVRAIKFGVHDKSPVVTDRIVCTANAGYSKEGLTFTNGSEYEIMEFLDKEKELELIGTNLSKGEALSQNDFMLVNVKDVNGDKFMAWIATDLEYKSSRAGTRKMLEYMNKHEDFFPPVLQYKFAQALTVHKSQGSEWPSVLYILTSRDVYNMGASSKNLNYTAVTRAKKNIDVLIVN